MSQSIKQLVITIFFSAQLFAVWALNRDEKPLTDVGEDVALIRYGFHLRESAKECGIDFIHESPQKLDGKLAHILPIIASMGASVSVVDFDKDGLLDLYVVTSREGGKNRLYRNNGNGTFTDVAEKLGVADLNKEAREFVRELSGATSTTMVMKIFLSTSGANPNCFAMSRGSHLSKSLRLPVFLRGSMPIARSGSIMTAMDFSICLWRAIGPITSTSGICNQRK